MELEFLVDGNERKKLRNAAGAAARAAAWAAARDAAWAAAWDAAWDAAKGQFNAMCDEALSTTGGV